MKLFEALKVVTVNNQDLLESIKEALEMRMEDVECQEPCCDSEFFYEKWEEKYESICEIVELAEDVLDEEDMEKKQKYLDELISEVESHQCEYSGLKRVKVWTGGSYTC